MILGKCMPFCYTAVIDISKLSHLQQQVQEKDAEVHRRQREVQTLRVKINRLQKELRIEQIVSTEFILAVTITFLCTQDQITSREGVATVQSPPQKSVATVQSPPQKNVAVVQSPPQKSQVS